MNLGIDVARRNFAIRGADLVIGGVAVRDLAARFGTPLFVYDAGAIDRRLADLRRVLPDRVRVYYSIKANPCQAILRRFVAAGCGLEIASAGEFFQARHAGCPAGSILFAGPGKTEAELRETVAGGIGEIHAESMHEIHALGEVARAADRTIDVAIRVNPGGEAQGGAMRMGGKPSPFGIDEERLEDAVGAVQREDGLRFSGVHLFIGTQILDAAVFERQYAAGLDIAARAAAIAGAPLHRVDFGGGLGIPYYPKDERLDIEAYGAAVHRVLDGRIGSDPFRDTEFIVEPGRFLVGEAGVYIARVTDVKESRGTAFAVTDGGMHHHLAASGNLGQIIKRNYPVAVLNRMDETPGRSVEVVGPLCTPLDVLARGAALPGVSPGDLVGVFQSGAYARASSPLGFLSHPSPAEVMVADGTATEVRRRGGHADLIADQVAP